MSASLPCEVRDLHAGYGDATVLHGITMKVDRREKVAIIGPNGAGKTTLIMVIVGLLRPLRGTVYIFGRNLVELKPHNIAKLGVGIVPEGGRIFPRLTVLENILAAMEDQRSLTLSEVFSLFPILRERKDQLAGTLSGGEQRMLAITRAIVRKPSFLIIDELSLGLGPKIVSQIYNALNKLWETTNISILITEQYVKRALEFSDRAYVIENGSIVLEGLSQDLIDNPYVIKAYLGV